MYDLVTPYLHMPPSSSNSDVANSELVVEANPLLMIKTAAKAAKQIFS
jgi:hypothetical protein